VKVDFCRFEFDDYGLIGKMMIKGDEFVLAEKRHGMVDLAERIGLPW
jgi:hypothetical protein